ncbi:MAG TPA: hypothetical protein VMR28_02270 [Candidatus Saccharimonadales bacterium]|nr:hypothetical protein [Candidatus Saccharimonadales bacterium]
MGVVSPTQIASFKTELQPFFAEHRREMSWRTPTLKLQPNDTLDPYAILVSEIMLQQTQAGRVEPKFKEFLTRFPRVTDLAQSQLSEVLTLWQGLGYNRRAKFLWQAAQVIENNFSGHFPQTSEELESLPGVGVNTAGATMVYAYNKPAIFVETNVRTVFIHHFFQKQQNISDVDIRSTLAQTLDRTNPRDFYWALMDYGSYLKGTVGNLTKASQSYSKQSAFQGSQRQIRGQILHLLTDKPRTSHELRKHIDDDRLITVLKELSDEQLISYSAKRYILG